jgi:hypothetical protein
MRGFRRGISGTGLALLVVLTAAQVGLMPSVAHAVDSRITNAAIYSVANSYATGTTVGDGQCFALGREVFRVAARNARSSLLIGSTSVYGYHNCYLQAGGIEVSAAKATRGDYIQVFNEANPYDYSHVHTAIIENNVGGGVFDVIEQNWPVGNGVAHRRWDSPYKWAAAGSRQVHIWRLGTVPSPPPPVVSSMAAGDFNGDGKDDVAALYNYGSGTSGLWIFQSTGTGFTPRLWWKSGLGAFNWANVKLTAGDFNGDGRDDVAALYNYGSGTSGLTIFRSTGTGFTPRLWWKSGLGGFNWANVKLTAGDFNGDGRDDVATLYNYGSGTSGLTIFRSTGTGFTPRLWWKSGLGGFNWANVKKPQSGGCGSTAVIHPCSPARTTDDLAPSESSLRPGSERLT